MRFVCVVYSWSAAAPTAADTRHRALDGGTDVWEACRDRSHNAHVFLVSADGTPQELGSAPRRHSRSSRAPADHGRALSRSLALAVELSVPGDLVYVVDDRLVHRPDALHGLQEGLLETTSQYVGPTDLPEDYWPPSAQTEPSRGEAAPVAVSEHHHWVPRSSLTGGFACRRGTLERDLQVLRYAARQQRVPRWREFWAAVAGRERILRSAIPVLATMPGWGEVATGWSRGGAARPRAAGSWARRPKPRKVAVLPQVSREFRDALRSHLPSARLEQIAGPAEVAGGHYTCVATTNLVKEELDGMVRASGSPVDTVFVELVDPSPRRSLRWVSGRDWLLPGHTGSPFVV